MNSSDFILGTREGPNGPWQIDLMIQAGRHAVVEALRELATSAQRKIAQAPESSQVQDYAYSLAWLYDRLEKCKELDPLIRVAASRKKRADELCSLLREYSERKARLIERVRELQTYVEPQPGRIPDMMWSESSRNALMAAELGPASLVSFWLQQPGISETEFLESLRRFLDRAPWVKPRQGLRFEYFARPDQRLEFRAACEALLPMVKAMERSVSQLRGIDLVLADARGARQTAHAAWERARKEEPFPPYLGSLLGEVIARQRTAKG